MNDGNGKKGRPPFRDDEEAALERARAALHEASDALEIAEGLRDKEKVTAPEETPPQKVSEEPDTEAGEEEPKGPWWEEIIQPFIDLVHAPRAQWGINTPYLLEGMCYFGFLGYLAIHFSSFIFKGVENADVHSHHMVMVLTAGITISMFFLGTIADKWGVRRALLAALCLMALGRLLVASAPTFWSTPGLWSSMHWATMAGIILIVIAYGMYQPAAYAGVKQFTSGKTAAMGFAMLYALMNLGGWLPTFAFMLRDKEWLGIGITGTYGVYTGFTIISLMLTILILTRRTEKSAIAWAKAEREKEGKEDNTEKEQQASEEIKPKGLVRKAWHWISHHPFADPKFTYFIFCLIPVQTLFAYNWLVLPQYINRSYSGWIGQYFEIASNFNPLLIFILVPMITAITQKRKVYNMMVVGTFVMAAPAFLLALGTNFFTLFGYLLIMTIGEAMWQPRFMQYAAEIAPEGRTGAYMGVAQFPWFLTKTLAPLYTGSMIAHFCPKEGPASPQTMWFWFGCIAMCSTTMLILAKRWVGKDFKTKAE